MSINSAWYIFQPIVRLSQQYSQPENFYQHFLCFRAILDGFRGQFQKNFCQSTCEILISTGVDEKIFQDFIFQVCLFLSREIVFMDESISRKYITSIDSSPFLVSFRFLSAGIFQSAAEIVRELLTHFGPIPPTPSLEDDQNLHLLCSLNSIACIRLGMVCLHTICKMNLVDEPTPFLSTSEPYRVLT